jgi:hypothetical protein
MECTRGDTDGALLRRWRAEKIRNNSLQLVGFHPTERRDQPSTRFGHRLGQRQEAVDSMVLPFMNRADRSREDVASGCLFQAGVAQLPCLLTCDRQSIEMRSKTVVAPSQITKRHLCRTS